MVKNWVLLASLFSSAALASAQEMDPPKEIKDLSWMVGTWKGEGPVTFGGQQTQLATTMTVTLEGQFIKIVSSDKSSDFTLTKTTMIDWDPAKSQYDSYSFTNIAPTARVEHGKMDAGKLVFVSDPWGAEGMTAVMRETFWSAADLKFGIILEFKNGEKWDKGMDYALTKQ